MNCTLKTGRIALRLRPTLTRRLPSRLYSSSTSPSIEQQPTAPEPTTPSPPQPQGSKKPRRKVIFSGIQPTGTPHLGNYLGALREWKRLQDTSDPDTTDLFFCVVDLHALTIPKPGPELRESREKSMAALLALGIDPGRSTLYFQSDVKEHAELAWLLSCTASVGYLSRMTQWKSKLHLSDNATPTDLEARQSLKLGLFSYPVLQAADILLHKATHVPVGDDQRQHLEFARECATNFNHVFVSSYVPKKPAQQLATMVAPEILLPPSAAGGRIMSLTNPSKKMSKSDPSYKSRILLSDPDNVIHKKIRAAVTDSLGPVTYEPDQRPGVANLLNILSALDAKGRDPETLAKEEGLWGEDMVTLKDAVSHAVCAELEPIRERYERWAKAPEKVREAIAESTERARRSAEKNMEAYRRVVGFGV